MRLVTTTGTLREDFESRVSVYARGFAKFVRVSATFAEAHGGMAFAAISLWCIWLRFASIGTRRLGHDELYTYYIAQSSSLHRLLELTRSVDLHPPLSYLLVRLSFALFGVSSWSCRLPFVLAFVCATVLLYSFLARTSSPLTGLTSVLFLWSFPFTIEASNARPYSLVLCFTVLILVSWHQAAEGMTDRGWALLSLTLGGFGLLLSHVLSVLPYSAVVAAEIVRSYRRRKSDWAVWAALLVPWVTVITYVPLLGRPSGMLFTPAYQVTPIRLLRCYWEPIRFIPSPLLVALAAILTSRTEMQASVEHHSKPAPFSFPLGVALAVLLLVPIAIAILFSCTHTAFFERYGVVVLVPLAMIPALVLAHRTRSCPPACAAVALCTAAVLYFNTSGKVWLMEEVSNLVPPKAAVKVLYLTSLPSIWDKPMLPPVPAGLIRSTLPLQEVSGLDQFHPELPLVAGTALVFMELDHAENYDVTRRLYLLTDREAASTIAHDTVFENYEQIKAVFPIRGMVTSYCSFITSHPHFLVLGAYSHPQGWLLRKLEMDGAQMKIVGEYSKTLEGSDLYEITVPAKVCGSAN